MSTNKFFFAGAGGQGILLMGQMLAYGGMYDNKEVTFMPSYGPEMRGGTANCTVIVSDEKINCPMIYEADTVIAMNQPSLQSFERLVKPGGNLFINQSLVQTEPIRSDISIYKVPCSELANELGNTKAANMVMFGAILSATKILSEEAIEYVLQKVFSGKKAKHLDLNRRAIKAFKCE
ncbi:MAG: 2-oxoacid:acceptor oxidoreductase family protein [Anaerovoracaceae bacterium]|nr:2-oxoacid:acceptor oxidoreductase family protein [Bacillota bacterium]MDY3955027.1 2-oxoacid:acceptor oxidoreductase family protein [Anaerovoracaceae bacterium]